MILSLRQQEAVMNFLWPGFSLCKGIIDFFSCCQLLVASFSSQHIHILQTSSVFLKSPHLLLMGDVQHLVEPGEWMTSSEHPTHKILLSSENACTRTWGNFVWAITQRYFSFSFHWFMLLLQPLPRNIQRAVLLPCVPML